MSSGTRGKWLKRVVIMTLVAGGVVGAGWGYRHYQANEAPAYQTAVVSRGEVIKAVTATGQLNPLVQVQVGSQISGNIQKLLGDFNSTVTQAQVVAQLDPATYEANFVQAQGNLANARASLEFAELNEKRTRSLRADKLNAQVEYERALADLHQAQANLTIYEGALKKAQVDLARCTIYSPISGIVISRNVDVGQTVAASLSAPTLFLIANDLSRMQIDANVAEADIGQVEVGQRAEFTVDAFPGQVFQGTVTQIRNAPKTDQNVVTYDTMIDVTNDSLKLKPGMTANISIIVARRSNVLKVANAALRFHPPKHAVLIKPAENPGLGTAATTGSQGAGRVKAKGDKPKGQRTVYRWREGGLEPAKVRLGISDGRYTELLDGLGEKDEVVVDVAGPVEKQTRLASLFSRLIKRE